MTIDTTPVPFATTDIVGMVDELMDCMVTAATELSVTLPSRQIAGTGLIPVDCDQATVSLIQIGTGGVESRSGSSTYPNPGSNLTLYNLVCTMTITRKSCEIPQSPLGQNPPPVSAWANDLTSISADIAVIARAIDIFANRRMSPVTRIVTPGPPQGGYITVSARVTTDTV